MNNYFRCGLWGLVVLACLGAMPACANESLTFGGVEFSLGEGGRAEISKPLQVMLLLTVLSLAPAFLVVVTSFTRIVIVLAMLRHALGTPALPPNSVLISLALFLTVFTMLPVAERIQDDALAPYSKGQLTADKALALGGEPLKDFMLRQTRESDLLLVARMAKASPPVVRDDVNFSMLIPAFMLSELQTAFQIGFVIFLPFLAIDLVVATLLMAMGMIMVPPTTISLPLKILLFVLIEGWALVVEALLGSFR